MSEASGLILDLPNDREPIAAAVYAHGFGDTEDGPIGRALARECTANGIALARISLVDILGKNLLTVSYSEQAKRLDGAVETFETELPNVPCHIISHSQGAFAASEIAADGPDRRGGLLVLTAPPLENPFDRLKGRLATTDLVVPPSQAGLDIIGAIPQPDPRRHILVTESFWREAAEIQPFPLIKESYDAGSTLIMLAGDDKVLGKQERQVAALQEIDDSSIEVLDGADHGFTKGSRTKLAKWVAFNLRAATARLIEAA